jgi:hypothetical protein
MLIQEFEYRPGKQNSIIGEFETGQTVFVEVWNGIDSVVLVSSGCNEIDETGRYSWSINNLGIIPRNRVQYHWRMTDGLSGIQEGDFILFTNENQDGYVPKKNNIGDYIKEI